MNVTNQNILNKPIQIWVAIAKNGTIQLFSKLPTRGKSCWIGDVYINSMIYKSIENMIKNSSMCWASEPEYLELSYQTAQ